MDSKQSKRNKSIGYTTEVAAIKALKPAFPNLKRTGSTAYSKAAADIVQVGTGTEANDPPLRLIVTRDLNKELLVTLSVGDLLSMISLQSFQFRGRVVIQVKSRQKTWVGGLYAALKEATSGKTKEVREESVPE